MNIGNGKCGTCRYFCDPVVAATPDVSKTIEENTEADCRCNPPSIQFVAAASGQIARLVGWPRVVASLWCGSYVEAPKL